MESFVHYNPAAVLAERNRFNASIDVMYSRVIRTASNRRRFFPIPLRCHRMMVARSGRTPVERWISFAASLNEIGVSERIRLTISFANSWRSGNVFGRPNVILYTPVQLVENVLQQEYYLSIRSACRFPKGTYFLVPYWYPAFLAMDRNDLGGIPSCFSIASKRFTVTQCSHRSIPWIVKKPSSNNPLSLTAFRTFL